MNLDTADAASGYLETLYDINKRILRIYCMIGKNPGFLLNNIVLDIIALIPRIIPYSSKYIKKLNIREIKFEKTTD